MCSWKHVERRHQYKKRKEKDLLRLGLISKCQGQRIVMVSYRVSVQFYEKNMLRKYIKIIVRKIVNAVRCEDFTAFFFFKSIIRHAN